MSKPNVPRCSCCRAPLSYSDVEDFRDVCEDCLLYGAGDRKYKEDREND